MFVFLLYSVAKNLLSEANIAYLGDNLENLNNLWNDMSELTPHTFYSLKSMLLDKKLGMYILN